MSSVSTRSARAPRAGWRTELALGVRLSVAGGRSGWLRLAMIALGIALGVAVLLLTATAPNLLGGSSARADARQPAWGSTELSAGASTVLLSDLSASFAEEDVRGYVVQAEGSSPVLPPGVERFPADGELVVSPALAELLDSDEGTLLRDRWGTDVVGTIGASGLRSPEELYVYVGSDDLTADSGFRVAGFGSAGGSTDLDPLLLTLTVVGLVALLLPVAVFVTTAVRFGAETRERQLAALRLVGADSRTTRHVAAGETLTGATLGLLLGAALYGLVGILAHAAGLGFFAADFRPVPALVAVIVVLVLGGSVAVSISALRGVTLEPLGVVRHSTTTRRRLWWRLLLPAGGLALLWPLTGGLPREQVGFEYQVMGGVGLLLVGVALLLPWVVEATVRRLGGGSVAWQLAVRRLQVENGTAVRAVSGIAVSVAAVIAVQGLLVAVEAEAPGQSGGAGHYDVRVYSDAPDLVPALEGSAGVADTAVLSSFSAVDGTGQSIDVLVAGCDVLRELVVAGNCADGDVFTLTTEGTSFSSADGSFSVETADGQTSWTVPADARSARAVDFVLGMSTTRTVLATPAAFDVPGAQPRSSSVFIALGADPTAFDQVQNTVASVDLTALVSDLSDSAIEGTLATVRQALLIGAVVLLSLIGLSLLVNSAEQLRERRRLLAVLTAFGTQRSVLALSVLFQITIPVVIGMVLAVLTGSLLATVLQIAAQSSISLDVVGIGAASGAAALVVLAATAGTLPMLWRLTRSGALRHE